MRWLRDGSQAEMIALFLRGELTSDRYGPEIQALLERDGLSKRVITNPDLEDRAENQVRLELLAGYREDYLDNFPEDVTWQWMAVTAAELAEVSYIDYSYWNELSGGTRRPSDAAARIRLGVTPFGVPNDRHLGMAKLLASGTLFEPLILVGTAPGERLVVLEGHCRLTGYMLAPELLPPELEVMVGFSPTMARWL
jgi:hypothetical protein